MTKVLVFQEKIMPYRVPIFNLLASKTDTTILTVSTTIPPNITARVEVADCHSFGRLKWVGVPFKRLINESDVVVFPLVSSWLDTWMNLSNRKFVFWGIGVPASYNTRYDSKGNFNAVSWLVKMANACLFYSEYPIHKYSNLGYDTQNMFVANNTVFVHPSFQEHSKDIVLFVGSLYPQKKIETLLEAYKAAYFINSKIPKLVIVGDGTMRASIEAFIKGNSLTQTVELTGEIYDEKVLSLYFARAFACFSPDQAGLSVLKSMGYGVPYVTHKDAITGGERFNITNNINGFLIDDFKKITDIILDIAKNPSKYIQLGRAAKEHYNQHCTPQIMVDGFLNAIEYVISHK